MNLFIEKADKRLLKEWNYEKNTDYDINKMAAVSGKKVWWKCKEGHEWQAAISHRINGRNCPVCCGKKVQVGYNDLLTLKPEIAKEWDYKKNDGLSPQMVTVGSNKRVWWKCKKGHEWNMIISARTRSNSGCPVCKGKVLCEGYNDLQTKHPELIKEWDFSKNGKIKPEKVLYNSYQKVWWICNQGHEWEDKVAYRSKGKGCPICTKEKANKALSTPDKNQSFLKLYPDIAKEWNYKKNGTLFPSDVKPKSEKKVWWVCIKGHEWEATIGHRVNGTGCPICSGKKIQIGYNDLSFLKPDVAKEWNCEKNNNLTPQMVTVNSNKRVWWKCSKCGKEWLSSVADRTRGQGCPQCAYVIRGKKRSTPQVGESLQDKYPDIAKEWDYDKNGNLGPESVCAVSNKKIWWKCIKGHEWQAHINNRVKGNGCPYCSGRRVLAGFNDLETTNPRIALEWNYKRNQNLSPQNVMAGTNKKVWWICEKGHEWATSVNARTSNGTNCPYCSCRKLLIGYNDLKTKYPELMKEWNYKKNKKDPSEYNCASMENVWWICNKGHEWKSRINNRSLLKRGCPICSQELRTSFPEQVVFYYIKSIYADAISGDRNTIEGQELDVFIPSINTAIEYDGIAWHSNEVACTRERRKNAQCKKKGIRLIRIREKGLKKYSNCICVLRENNSSQKDLENATRVVIAFLKGDDFSTDIDIDRDRGKIQSFFEMIEKKNSLEEVFPEVAKTWDYNKNGKLLPSMVTAYSNRRVWWKCTKGHEWIVSINNRVRVAECPICNNKKLRIGYNDLLSRYPEVVKEWNYEKNEPLGPNEIMYNSCQKVWWVCSAGHTWEATPFSRCKRGTGCPVCSPLKRGKSIPATSNSLKALYPDIAKEWNYERNTNLSPDEVAGGSNKLVWWICSKGHEWQAKIGNRTFLNRGCPYCSGRYVITGETDLKTVNPNLAGEWNYDKNDDLRPENILPSTNKKVWWICSKGHEWQATVNSRSRGCNCPVCAGRKSKMKM